MSTLSQVERFLNDARIYESDEEERLLEMAEDIAFSYYRMVVEIDELLGDGLGYGAESKLLKQKTRARRIAREATLTATLIRQSVEDEEAAEAGRFV